MADIIKADKSRRYVVPSAPGKRNDKDEKVTDMLYACYDAVAEGRSYKKILDKIKERYNEIIDGLDLNLNLDHEFDKIEENFLAKAGRDYAASRGEYLNGIVMANYLGFCFIDAAEVIRFHEDAVWMTRKQTNCSPFVLKGKNLLSSLDSTVRKKTEPLSLFPAAVLISQALWLPVQLWLTCMKLDRCIRISDRRSTHCYNPKSIETITYRELHELSYMGATVLHEDAIFPVRKVGIPINIRNTNAPQDKGTLIVESTCRQPKYTITGIAGTDGFAAVTIEKAMMNSEIGFCRKVLEEFDKTVFPSSICLPASIQ